MKQNLGNIHITQKNFTLGAVNLWSLWPWETSPVFVPFLAGWSHNSPLNSLLSPWTLWLEQVFQAPRRSRCETDEEKIQNTWKCYFEVSRTRINELINAIIHGIWNILFFQPIPPSLLGQKCWNSPLCLSQEVWVMSRLREVKVLILSFQMPSQSDILVMFFHLFYSFWPL